MARKCEMCGRGSVKDASRSHSNIKTIKRQYINLQTKTIGGKRTKVCAKCIKTMKKKVIRPRRSGATNAAHAN